MPLHVLKEAPPFKCASLDNADEISLSIVNKHIDECYVGGIMRAMKMNANMIFNKEVYGVMENVPTREFDFVVNQTEVEDVDVLRSPVNAFDMLRV